MNSSALANTSELRRRRVLDLRASQLVWLCVIAAMACVSAMKGHVLPAKLFLDAATIHEYMRGGGVSDWQIGASYPNTGKLYMLLHLRSVLTVTTVQTVVVCVLFWRYLKRIRVVSWTDAAIIWLFGAACSIYLTQFSKDFFTFLLCAGFVECCSSRKKLMAWTAVALLYAMMFRSYWFLVICGFWAFYVVAWWLRSPLALLAAFASMLLALAIAFEVILGVPLDHFRQTINMDRIGSINAQTLIPAYVHGGSISTQWFNAMIVAGSFLLPLPLVLLGDVYHATLACVLLFVSVKMLSAVRRAVSGGMGRDGWACASLLLAFLLIQSVFEPDYGSAVRHLCGLAPAVLYLVTRSPRLAQVDGRPGHVM